MKFIGAMLEKHFTKTMKRKKEKRKKKKRNEKKQQKKKKRKHTKRNRQSFFLGKPPQVFFVFL
jgi:hypothetical protein